MITAVDTNILFDVFGADPRFGAASSEALRACLKEGSLVASDVVWAETAMLFTDIRQFRNAMKELLTFLPMTEQAAEKAADAWRKYRARGGRRERIAADFLIGAHAQVLSDRILTRDRGFYREYFSGLKVLDPTTIR
jgi:predicted nucleic acid-binding protein